MSEGTGIPEEQYPAFVRYVESEREREEKKYAEVALADGYSKKLRQAFDSYVDATGLEPGDLVQWKPMMRNRFYPLEGTAAIVVRELNPPQLLDSDGDPLAEPLDVVIGLVDGENVFRLTAVASARLMRLDA